MMFYPISSGKLVNVLAIKYTPGHGRTYDGPWVEPTTGEAIVKLFEGWEPNALALIKVRSFFKKHVLHRPSGGSLTRMTTSQRR